MTDAKKEKKGKGLSSMLNWAFEEGEGEPSSAPVATTPPLVSPTPTNPPSTAAYPTYAAVPTAAASGLGSFISTQPTAPDEKALATVEASVYADFDGRKSRFLPFLQMYHRLGRPADVGMVLGALQITDPGFTAEVVAGDAQMHLNVLEKFCTSIDAEFASETAARIGGIDAEAKGIADQNAADAAEIERLTKEVADRSAKLPALAQQRAEEDAAIQRGKAKMDVAEEFVRSTLKSTLTLFNKTV